ncbi:MAG: PAS domain S-box protein [Fretibacterium sp.]|nr:PAS domain S-box protein [Fretibacterium sp.]
MGNNSSVFKWISIPPVVLILTFLLPRFLGSPEYAVHVDRSIWATTVILFVVFTALYALFILYGYDDGLLPLQCILQGIMLCILALSNGARMVEWIGVVMAAGGAVALVSVYNQDQQQGVVNSAQKAREAESHIPIPFAVTNAEGNILNISDAMLEASGLSHEETDGRSIGLILTPGDDSVELKGRKWDIQQKSMEGERVFFQLEESKPEPVLPPVPPADADPFVDTATGLNTFLYTMRRLDDEIYRLRRYGSPMTVFLIRVALPGSLEETRVPFIAFCTLLKSKLRELDMAANTRGTDVLIVLPECREASAESVLRRILSLVSSLCSTHDVFYNATTLSVSISPESTEDAPKSAMDLLDQLENNLQQKYSMGA